MINLSDRADSLNILERSDSSAKESGEQGFRRIEKCNQSALRNVVELHLGNEKPSDSADVDMVTIETCLPLQSVYLASLTCHSCLNVLFFCRKKH